MGVTTSLRSITKNQKGHGGKIGVTASLRGITKIQEGHGKKWSEREHQNSIKNILGALTGRDQPPEKSLKTTELYNQDWMYAVMVVLEEMVQLSGPTKQAGQDPIPPTRWLLHYFGLEYEVSAKVVEPVQMPGFWGPL